MYFCPAHIDEQITFKGGCNRCAQEKQNYRDRKVEKRKRSRERALYVAEREYEDE